MDILTLELFDVTVSQALLELQRTLEQHSGMPIRLLMDRNEMLLHNLQRFLDRHGRRIRTSTGGHPWCIEVEAGEAPRPLPAQPNPDPPPPTPRPVVLLRSAFAPGDRALGRRLLLGVLEALAPGTPWLGLAHGALELLEEDASRAALDAVRSRGIPVRISRESLRYLGGTAAPFEVMDDREWQSLAAGGGLILL